MYQKMWPSLSVPSHFRRLVLMHTNSPSVHTRAAGYFWQSRSRDNFAARSPANRRNADCVCWTTAVICRHRRRTAIEHTGESARKECSGRYHEENQEASVVYASNGSDVWRVRQSVHPKCTFFNLSIPIGEVLSMIGRQKCLEDTV